MWKCPKCGREFDKPIPFELIAEITKWCHETGNHH
jgi:hypothetical protein